MLDAHNQAFELLGGVPKRMVYDNLKTVVDAIFVGKERRFNRRFLTLANHYLFEPVACTPESGWEKGQVENQVGNISEWLFTPTPKFADLAELNAWLAQRCRELALRPHPDQPSRTVADCFAEEHCIRRYVGYSWLCCQSISCSCKYLSSGENTRFPKCPLFVAVIRFCMTRSMSL